jgi:hypothetical protein
MAQGVAQGAVVVFPTVKEMVLAMASVSDMAMASVTTTLFTASLTARATALAMVWDTAWRVTHG